MLGQIGYDSLEYLIDATIPEKLRFRKALALPEAEAEFVEAEDAAEEPEEEISPLERLRADVIAKLKELPERDRKNVLAGKTPPSKADETELRALLAAIEN